MEREIRIFLLDLNANFQNPGIEFYPQKYNGRIIQECLDAGLITILSRGYLFNHPYRLTPAGHQKVKELLISRLT